MMVNILAPVVPAHVGTQMVLHSARHPRGCGDPEVYTSPVILANAGIQRFCTELDSRLRGNDDGGCL